MEKIVVANWKMNGGLSKINADLSYYASSTVTNKPNVILALPYLYIVWTRQEMLVDSKIKTAAQDLSHCGDYGAYTGQISGAMLKDAGVDYVIIGHSERRTLMGEDDNTLIHKVKNAFNNYLTPIFCIGEPESARNNGNHLDFIEKQLSLLGKIELIQDMVIAYEPCWSIGTGKIPTITEIGEVVDFINRYMQSAFPYAKIALLYGGSVTSQNAREILSVPNIGGLLVGGASLRTDDFTAICKEI